MKKIFYVVVVLLAWWAYACYDDEPSVPWEIPRNPEWNAFFQDLDAKVERAMTWYEENRRMPQLSRSMQIVDSLMRDSFESQFELLVPLWNSAFVSSDEKRGLVAVEVPLWGKVQIQHVLEENSLAYDETGNVNYLMSYSRLVILTETDIPFHTI